MTDLFATLSDDLARQFGEAIRAIPFPHFPAKVQTQDAPQGSAAGEFSTPETTK